MLHLYRMMSFPGTHPLISRRHCLWLHLPADGKRSTKGDTMLAQLHGRLFSIGTTFSLLPFSSLNSARRLLDSEWMPPSKHEALTQCCFDVGPPSSTAGQHQSSIGSMPRVCWGSRWIIREIYSANAWLETLARGRPLIEG